MILITIPGPPVAMKRPRFRIRGKFVQVYSDQHEERKRHVVSIVEQYSGQPLTEPVSMRITFYMPLPKSAKRDLIAHVKKPDVDNLIKWTFDCLQAAEVLDDDKIVFSVHARKQYCDNPRTEVVIL